MKDNTHVISSSLQIGCVSFPTRILKGMSNVHYISMPVTSDATPGYPTINKKHKCINSHQSSL